MSRSSPDWTKEGEEQMSHSPRVLSLGFNTSVHLKFKMEASPFVTWDPIVCKSFKCIFPAKYILAVWLPSLQICGPCVCIVSNWQWILFWVWARWWSLNCRKHVSGLLQPSVRLLKLLQKSKMLVELLQDHDYGPWTPQGRLSCHF